MVRGFIVSLLTITKMSFCALANQAAALALYIVSGVSDVIFCSPDGLPEDLDNLRRQIKVVWGRIPTFLYDHPDEPGGVDIAHVVGQVPVRDSAVSPVCTCLQCQRSGTLWYLCGHASAGWQ